MRCKSLPSRWIVLVALGTMVLAMPTETLAQRMVGTVIDETSGEGVESVTLQLLNEMGAAVGPRAISNADGRFTLLLPSPGIYKIVVNRIGYGNTTTATFDLRTGEVRVTLTILLVPQIITLADILVDVELETGNRLRGIALESFRQRERIGLGRFFDKDDMEMWGDRPFDLVFKTLPNVQVGGNTSRDVVLTRGGTSCAIRWFIDGIRIRPFPSVTEIPLEVELLRATDIEAVEMYRTEFEIPGEFGAAPMDPTCAAVVIWTKR